MKKNSTGAKPTTLAAILLLSVLISLLIIGLSRVSPDGISDFFIDLLRGERSNHETPSDAEYADLFSALAGADTAPPRPLDSLSLTEAFAHFPFAESYTHIYTVRYSDGERESTKCISLTREGEAYQLLIFEGETVDPTKLYESIIFDGSVYVAQDMMGNRRVYTPGEDFPLSSVAMLPDTNTFCAILAEYEKDPSASPFSACSAVIEDAPEGRVLVLRFTDRETGSNEEYRYLLDYGILHSATGTRDGLVWYALDTIKFSDGAAIIPTAE